MKLEPASSIIARFGGHREVSDILGVNLASVYRWTYPRGARGGTDGIIPMEHARTLYEEAKKRGLNITAEDFFAPQAGQVRKCA